MARGQRKRGEFDFTIWFEDGACLRWNSTQAHTDQDIAAAIRRYLLPVAERIESQSRKVTDVRNVPWTVNWKPEHVLIWERVHGPLPAGHCLWFTDGNRRHVDLANLELHTRRELMARNTVHNLPEPLARTIQLLGALNRKIRRSTREEQDRGSAESPLRNAGGVEG